MSRRTVGKKKPSEDKRAWDAGMRAYGSLERWIRGSGNGPGFETLDEHDRDAVRHLHASLGELLHGALR